MSPSILSVWSGLCEETYTHSVGALLHTADQEFKCLLSMWSVDTWGGVHLISLCSLLVGGRGQRQTVVNIYAYLIWKPLLK